LQARINVNLYAGWRTSHGFDVHWDSHDVFILQVAGKKLWKVWEATDKFPIKNSVELGRTPPAGAPLWDQFLNDGDVLYLPRGWWHVAIPCDEPTLHLTIGIHKPNGTDFVRWVTEGLQNDPRVRMDVPFLGDTATQAAYITAIRESIREVFEAPGLLLRFQQHSSEVAGERPYFGLPSTATADVLPTSEESIMTLASARGLDLRTRDDGAVDVTFNGKLLTFAGAAKPLLSFLSDQLPVSIAVFYQQFADQYERDTLRQFLTEMAKHGVIVALEPPPAKATRRARV